MWTVRSVDLVLEMTDQALAQTNLAQVGTDPAKRAEMARLVGRLPYIGALWIIDEQGQVRFTTAPGSPTGSGADRPYFQAHRDGVLSFISPQITGRLTGQEFFAISRRLERDGKFAGVVLAAFNPTYFPAFGRSFGLGDSAEVAIVNGNGELIVSTGQRYTAAIATLSKNLRPKGAASQNFASVRSTTPDGVDYLLAKRPISAFGLTAVYIAPWSDLMSDWMRRFWIGSSIIALAVMVIGGGAALALTFGRRQSYLRNVLGMRTAEAKRSNERLELAIESTGIGIFDYDMRRKSLAWAGVEPGHFGLPAVEGLSPSRFMRHVHPADRLPLVRELRRLRSRQSDGAASIEFRMRHPDAGQIWVAARGRIFGSASSSRVAHRIIGTIRDVTEQRLLQEHKDMVLREINHRIKNSLQLMNSIMNLQSRRIASAEERGRFEVARRRLVALATVYAHLDDTARPDTVELIGFLRRLCRDFSVAYMSDGHSALAFTGEGEVQVPTTQAVPLGMAVGEILVNLSLQSNENNAKGLVRVDVKVKANQVEVRVIDSDSIAVDAFGGAAGPLSYTLIHAFVDQIGGKLTISDVDGGTWLIGFAAENVASVGRPPSGGGFLMSVSA